MLHLLEFVDVLRHLRHQRVVFFAICLIALCSHSLHHRLDGMVFMQLGLHRARTGRWRCMELLQRLARLWLLENGFVQLRKTSALWPKPHADLWIIKFLSYNGLLLRRLLLGLGIFMLTSNLWKLYSLPHYRADI